MLETKFHIHTKLQAKLVFTLYVFREQAKREELLI
jgi:hypothetical protein